MVKASNVASRRCTSRDPSTGEMFKMTCRCVCVCVQLRGAGACMCARKREERGRKEGERERWERGRRIDCRSARMLRCVGQGTASHLCGLAAARGACARRRPGRRQRPSASHPSLRTAIKRVVSEECGIGGNNLCGLSAREDAPRQDRGYPQSSTSARCLLPGDLCVLCAVCAWSGESKPPCGWEARCESCGER